MFAIFSLRRPDILPVGRYFGGHFGAILTKLSQAILVCNVASFAGYYHYTSQSTASRCHRRSSQILRGTRERPRAALNSSQRPQSPKNWPKIPTPPPLK